MQARAAAFHDAPLALAVVQRLKKFRKYSRFKRKVLMSVAHLLPTASLLQLRKAFFTIDRDGNGYIDFLGQ